MTGEYYDSLLAGRDDGSELGRLLAAARGPAAADELTGLGPALAAFRDASASAAAATRVRRARRWLVLKVLAVASGASLAGGVAYAATNGGLLGGAEPAQLHHRVSQSASADPHGGPTGAAPTSGDPGQTVGRPAVPAVPPSDSAAPAGPPGPTQSAAGRGAARTTAHGTRHTAPGGSAHGSAHGSAANGRSTHPTPRTTPPLPGRKTTPSLLHGPPASPTRGAARPSATPSQPHTAARPTPSSPRSADEPR